MTAVCFNGEEGGRCLHGRVFGVSVVSVQCFVFSFIEREKTEDKSGWHTQDG